MESKKWNIDSAREFFISKGLNLLSTEYKEVHSKLDFIDSDGYKSSIQLANLQTGQSYYKFHKTNKFTIENIQHYLDLNNINTKILSKSYNSNSENLSFLCECGNVFKTSWSKMQTRNKNKCQDCIKKRILEGMKFSKDKMSDLFKVNELEYISGEYINQNSIMNFSTKEGYFVKTTPQRLAIKKSPYIFSLKFNKENFRHNIEKYIEINNLTCEFVDAEIVNDDRRILLTLKCECGEIFSLAISHFITNRNIQYRCSKCSTVSSTYSVKTENWLIENNVVYEKEKQFEGCKAKRNLRFDFYIPSKNVCIEVDGQQHYYDNGYFKRNNCMEYDKIKNKYCEENGIKLIRVPFWHFYDEKYKKTLLNIDLN